MLKQLSIAVFLAFGSLANVQSAAQAQSQAPTIDRTQFIRMAASGDMFEIESSKLALGKPDDANVKKFAQMLIDDHTAASRTLMSIAGEKLPATMEKKHMDMLANLKDADGKQFTQLYVTLQLQAHKEAVDLFDGYSKNGSDAKLKRFAAETLPKLRTHLEMAQKLSKS